MDIRYFLQERLTFIRQLYRVSSEPYFERIRQIEAQQEPWVPEYSEDGEPPFLIEWLEADESIQVLGRSCISMLVASLHIYLQTWQKIIAAPLDGALKAEFKERGWIRGYQLYFAQHAGISFERCPSNLKMFEELVLARNQIQHPSSITTVSSSYSNKDLRKVPHPFFVDEREEQLLSEADEGEREWLLPPAIRITSEKLNAALLEVERFAEWLESVETQKQ